MKKKTKRFDIFLPCGQKGAQETFLISKTLTQRLLIVCVTAACCYLVWGLFFPLERNSDLWVAQNAVCLCFVYEHARQVTPLILICVTSAHSSSLGSKSIPDETLAHIQQ